MYHRIGYRAVYAYALYHAGDSVKARTLYQQAERLRQENFPNYILQNFELVLLNKEDNPIYEEDIEKAKRALKATVHSSKSLLDIALNQLGIGRFYLQQNNYLQAADWLSQTVKSFKAAESLDQLPRGLLARATLYRQTQDFARAHEDLQGVFDIADGSGMRLYLTDYHLEMARLLMAEALTPTPLPEVEGLNDPSSSPSTAERERGLGGEGITYHITEAERLINETGYHRRDKELADLKVQL